MTSLIGIPFIILWILFILLNALAFYSTHIKKKFSSSIPLVGGVFGLIGFYQIPSLRKWCWVAVLLDYGSIGFLIAMPKVARELWQTSRINLVSEFSGKENARNVTIRLYKGGVLVIKHRIVRKKDEAGLVASSDIGSWREADGTILLTLHSDTVALRRFGEAWRIERSFSHYAGNGDLYLYNIDFRQTPG